MYRSLGAHLPVLVALVMVPIVAIARILEVAAAALQ